MGSVMAVFIGGGLGSLARYGMSKLMLHLGWADLPSATLASNVFSSLILALLVYRYTPSQPWLHALLIIGFCGGFSTFSTFSYETVELFRSENYIAAIFNIAINTALCIFLLFVIAKSSK